MFEEYIIKKIQDKFNLTYSKAYLIYWQFSRNYMLEKLIQKIDEVNNLEQLKNYFYGNGDVNNNELQQL